MSETEELDGSRAPLLEHLIELRRRLLYSIAALSVAFGLCFWQARRILDFLVQPLVRAYGPKEHGTLIYTKLYEAFFTEVKVAMFAAFLLAFPIIANQIWLFVAPGLYKQEKRAFRPFLIATPILFLMGASLAYYVVMPTAFRFFLSFESTSGGINQQALPSIGDYLALVMQFIFGFGVSFLLPILLLLLERAGILTRKQLIAGRRYAIVGATAVAAVLTPPDIWSQLMLAVPLWLLYEISIIAIWFTERKRAKAETAQAQAQA